MKHLALSIFLAVAWLNASAVTRTVCNTPSGLAQFSDLQVAINTSASGDTIYVHGSPNTYAAVTITGKGLTIYGPGFAPDKQNPLSATVNGITFSGNCDGSHIQGLVLSGAVNFPNASTNNYAFVRNFFIQNPSFSCCNTATHSGWLFQGNYFQNCGIQGVGSFNTFTNWLIQNNVFYNNNGSVSISTFASCVNVLLDHNLFYGPSSTALAVFNGNSQFLTLTNNIFVSRDAAASNSLSTFNNNITFNAGNNTPWTSNSNSNAGGNIANTDPQMADQAGVNSGVNNALGDYTIAAGPANNAGSDGKDIGLLYDATGPLNWARSRGVSLPYIFSMNVTTPTVPAGGNISVNVEARQND